MTLMSSRGASLLSSLPPFFLLSDFYINYHPFCLACTPPQNTNFPPHLYSARLFSRFLSFPSPLISPLHIQAFFSGRPRSLHLPPTSLGSSSPSFHTLIPHLFHYLIAQIAAKKRGEFCLTGEVKTQTQLVGTQSQIPHHPPTLSPLLQSCKH